MQALDRHFLLLTHSAPRSCQAREWRFVLQPSGEGERITAYDVEPQADAMRLELLAVVRGLEALEGPCRVTLLCSNRFVRRGIRRDRHQWREHGWRWERFGKLVPVRDLDLWQRVDRALEIHRVECFAWNADELESLTSRFSDASAEGHFAGNAARGDAEIAPRSGRSGRTYLQHRQGVAVTRQLTLWGQEVFDSLAGLGRTALSRTA